MRYNMLNAIADKYGERSIEFAKYNGASREELAYVRQILKGGERINPPAKEKMEVGITIVVPIMRSECEPLPISEDEIKRHNGATDWKVGEKEVYLPPKIKSKPDSEVNKFLDFSGPEWEESEKPEEESELAIPVISEESAKRIQELAKTILANPQPIKRRIKLAPLFYPEQKRIRELMGMPEPIPPKKERNPISRKKLWEFDIRNRKNAIALATELIGRAKCVVDNCTLRKKTGIQTYVPYGTYINTYRIGRKEFQIMFEEGIPVTLWIYFHKGIPKELKNLKRN